MTATLFGATFSNSYVLWRKRCVMLRFVAVPELHFYFLCEKHKWILWKILFKNSQSLVGQPRTLFTLSDALFYTWELYTNFVNNIKILALNLLCDCFMREQILLLNLLLKTANSALFSKRIVVRYVRILTCCTL